MRRGFWYNIRMLAEGTVIGPYRVVRLLGKGGMAEVYEVENERLGARFALKAFTLDHGEVEFLRKRFRVEGRLLARLAHPRIVRVYDMDIDPATGLLYYVMDLVLDPTGRPRTLRDALESGEVTEEKVALWYEDLRKGLAYIHGAGVIHRDVTLENVLIGSDGRAVLSDFGVSKILPHDLRAELKETMNTLVRGDKPIMGKPFYLAPELKDGAEESAASDYFSLGVMILRLLTQVWYMPGAQLDDMLMPLDPMWRTILPRLLRDKPAERECVPWRQAKSASPIRLLSGEANTQEIFLRIRFPHWVIGTILFIAACTFVALTILAARERGRYNAAQSEVERLTRIIMELKK